VVRCNAQRTTLIVSLPESCPVTFTTTTCRLFARDHDDDSYYLKIHLVSTSLGGNIIAQYDLFG
jgi:hypothetical protein